METSVEMRVQDVRDMLTEKTNKIIKGGEEAKTHAEVELKRFYSGGFRSEFAKAAYEEDLAYYHSMVDDDTKKALDEVNFMEYFCNASANRWVRISKEDFKWLTN